MEEDDQRSVLERLADDPVVVAREELREALRAYSHWRWPWTRRRRRHALLAAFDAMLDVFVNRVMGMAGQAVVGPIETIRAQQGRHELRLTRLEQQMNERSDHDGTAT